MAAAVWQGLPKYVLTLDDKRWGDFNREVAQRLGWEVERFAGVQKARVGCTLSHLLLWQMAVARGHEAFVVFEDDARCSRELSVEDTKAVQHFLQLANGPGVLLLGYNQISQSLVVDSEPLAQGHALDLHASIIKRSEAQRLLRKYARMMRDPLHQCFAPAGTIDTIFLLERVWLLRPMVFVQADNPRYKNQHLPSKAATLVFTCANYLVFHKEQLVTVTALICALLAWCATRGAACKRGSQGCNAAFVVGMLAALVAVATATHYAEHVLLRTALVTGEVQCLADPGTLFICSHDAGIFDGLVISRLLHDANADNPFVTLAKFTWIKPLHWAKYVYIDPPNSAVDTLVSHLRTGHRVVMFMGRPEVHKTGAFHVARLSGCRVVLLRITHALKALPLIGGQPVVHCCKLVDMQQALAEGPQAFNKSVCQELYHLPP